MTLRARCTRKRWRGLRSKICSVAEIERHGQLCMHMISGADSLGEVQSSPATGPRARRPVKGSTTRQLPCRFMALGVNRRNSMAVEFGPLSRDNAENAW